MSLLKQTRLFGAFLILLIVGSGIYYSNIQSNLSKERHLYENIDEIVQGVFQLNIATSENLNNPTLRTFQQWQISHASLTSIIQKSMQTQNVSTKEGYVKIRNGLNKVTDLFFQIRNFTANTEFSTQAILTKLRSQVNLATHGIIFEGNKLKHNSIVRLAKKQNDLDNFMTSLIFATFVVVILTIIWIQRVYLSPILGLTGFAHSLIEGNYKSSIVENNNNELTDLSRAFNKLATTIDQKIDEASADWTWSTDQSLQYKYLSEGYQRITNNKIASILDTLIYDISDDKGDSSDTLKTCCIAKVPFKGVEYKIKTQSGDDMYVQIDGTPAFDAGGEFIGYRGSAFDVTDRKLAEYKLKAALESAEQASNAKSQFLAAMSHEIRTPLTGVIGLSELMIQSKLSSEQSMWANDIKYSGENLLSILNDVLDQSKLEVGKLELSNEDFHLASFVTDICDLFSINFKEKGVLLKCDLEDDISVGINSDRMRIGQILTNLLSNALKFTEEGDVSIHVNQTTQASGQTILKFSVKDTGVGLTKETQQKLFSPFTQADSSTSRIYGGTGLGLSISRQLAELMGGDIGVESELGEGATFWFTVLCKPAESEVTPRTKSEPIDRWHTSKSLNILLAEDNEINQQLIKSIMQNLNHSITIVENGVEAVEIMKNNQFDIILMDIRMPVMDGVEATIAIRSSGDNETPIIALTADISSEYKRDYLKIGMNDVCSKPINLPVLLTSINVQLNEDIHSLENLSRIDNTAIATHDCQNNTAINEEELDDVSSFDQVLDKVISLSTVEGCTASETLNAGSSLNEQLGDEFVELQSNFIEFITKECIKLENSISLLTKKNDYNEAKDDIKSLAHSLKGSGESFGYPLISTIATYLDDLISHMEEPSHDVIEKLTYCGQSLNLIARLQLDGDGGQAGNYLLQHLNKICSNSKEQMNNYV